MRAFILVLLAVLAVASVQGSDTPARDAYEESVATMKGAQAAVLEAVTKAFRYEPSRANETPSWDDQRDWEEFLLTKAARLVEKKDQLMANKPSSREALSEWQMEVRDLTEWARVYEDAVDVARTQLPLYREAVATIPALRKAADKEGPPKDNFADMMATSEAHFRGLRERDEADARAAEESNRLHQDRLAQITADSEHGRMVRRDAADAVEFMNGHINGLREAREDARAMGEENDEFLRGMPDRIEAQAAASRESDEDRRRAAARAAERYDIETTRGQKKFSAYQKKLKKWNLDSKSRLGAHNGKGLAPLPVPEVGAINSMNEVRTADGKWVQRRAAADKQYMDGEWRLYPEGENQF